MTIAQMLVQIRTMTNTNSVTFADSVMYRFASERHKQLVKTLTDMREGYLETTNSQNLVAGTQAYAFPAALRVKRAEVLYASTGTWKKLKFFDINQLSTPNDTSTIPQVFSQTYPYADVSGDNLMLYPIPDANVTNGLKIWYVAVPSDFSATSDTPSAPAEFHRFLCDLVAIDVRQMKGELTTAQAIQEEVALMQYLKQQVSPRVADQDSLMKPVRINYE